MSDIPIGAQPNVHSWAHANIGCNSCQPSIPATSVLNYPRDLIVLRMQPGQDWPDKPLAADIPRLIRPIGQPESRLNIVAELCFLSSLRAKDDMKVFIGHEPPDVE